MVKYMALVTAEMTNIVYKVSLTSSKSPALPTVSKAMLLVIDNIIKIVENTYQFEKNVL